MPLHDTIRRRIIAAQNRTLGADQFAFPDVSNPPDISKVLPGFLADRTRPITEGIGFGSNAQIDRLERDEAALGRTLIATAEGRALGGGLAKASIAKVEADRAETDKRSLEAQLKSSEDATGKALIEGNSARSGLAPGSGRIVLPSGETIERGTRPSGIPGFEDLRVAFEKRTTPDGKTTEKFLPSARLNEPGGQPGQAPAETLQEKLKIPNKKQAATLRLAAEEKKKIPGTTVEQKQNIQRDLSAQLSGTTTPRMDEVSEAKAFAANPFEKNNIFDPSHISDIVQSAPNAFAAFRQATANYVNAPEDQAIIFKREYLRTRNTVEQIVKSRGASLAADKAIVTQSREQALVASRASVRRQDAALVFRTVTDKRDFQFRVRALGVQAAANLSAAQARDKRISLAEKEFDRSSKAAKAKNKREIAVDAAKSLGEVYDNAVDDLNDKADAVRSLLKTQNENIANAKAVLARLTDKDGKLTGTDEEKKKPFDDENNRQQAFDQATVLLRTGQREAAALEAQLNGGIDENGNRIDGLLREKASIVRKKAATEIKASTGRDPLAEVDAKKVRRRRAVALPTDRKGVAADPSSLDLNAVIDSVRSRNPQKPSESDEAYRKRIIALAKKELSGS